MWTRTIQVQAEVGNVTSKCKGVTRYHFSHVIKAVTLKSNNITSEL
jgi:hypothetical protein